MTTTHTTRTRGQRRPRTRSEQFPDLTRTQEAVLTFIASRGQYAPILSEIAAALGFRSKAAAHHHVARLVAAGYLTTCRAARSRARRTRRTDGRCRPDGAGRTRREADRVRQEDGACGRDAPD